MSSSVSGCGGPETMYLKHYAEALERRATTLGCMSWLYLQARAVLLLLLVYYPEAEVDLVRLLEVRLHLHDLRESLLRVVVGSESIVEDANAVPKFWFLERRLDSLLSKLKGEADSAYLSIDEIGNGVLVGRVSLLQVIHHKETVAYDDVVSTSSSPSTGIRKCRRTYPDCPRPRRCWARASEYPGDILQLYETLRESSG